MRMDSLARGLKADLRQPHLDEVQGAPVGALPPEPRPGDVASLTDLLRMSGGTVAVPSAITQILVAWVGQGRSRKGQVTRRDKALTLEGAFRRKQRRLVDISLGALQER